MPTYYSSTAAKKVGIPPDNLLVNKIIIVKNSFACKHKLENLPLSLFSINQWRHSDSDHISH